MNIVDVRAWDTRECKMIPVFTNYAGWCAMEMENAWNDPRYVKQMFTGECDIHGCKIYDGDLLLNTICGDIWVVEFKDAMFVAKLVGDYVEEPLGYLDGFEVVGNVFENNGVI